MEITLYLTYRNTPKFYSSLCILQLCQHGFKKIGRIISNCIKFLLPVLIRYNITYCG